ncbi:DUF4131 domain-containing protein, partial [Undibacterium sp.]|uniref:DUF4131 domain-containing protein n=1 Tax=Undibacterium sp. TaxID=1914977 RepID=UPI003752D15E
MRSAILGFVLGVALLQQQAALFKLLHVCTAFVVFCSLAMLLSQFQTKHFYRSAFVLSVVMRFVVAMGLGFCWASLLAHYQLRQELPAQWESRDLVVQGVIDQLPGTTANGTRFNFTVERYLLPASALATATSDQEETQAQSRIQTSTDKFPKRLALGWFDDP